MVVALFIPKLIRAFSFHHIHPFLIILPALFQDMLDLCNRNYREIFREQEITGKEQSEGTQVKTHFPDGRCVIGTPGRRQVIAVQRSNDDHKTLEPHTHVHDNGHEESDDQAAPHFTEPEDLRRQNVTTHHEPVAPSIRTVQVGAVLEECKHLVLHVRVPGHEQFGQVGDTHNGTRQYDHLVHYFNVLDGNVLF